MQKIRSLLLSLVLFTSLFSLWAVRPASAHPTLSAHASARSLQAQTTSPHLTGCTPGSYHLANKTYVLDQGTYTVLGYVAIYADGCGWVQAEALGGTLSSGYFGIVNHLTIYNSNGRPLLQEPIVADPINSPLPFPLMAATFTPSALFKMRQITTGVLARPT